MTFGYTLQRFKNPVRRATLAAAISLGALGMLMGSMPAKAADFAARDATRYAENPNLAPYGLTDIIVAYESSLWPAGASRTTPDLNHIRTKYIPKIKSKNPDVVIIDIEHYKFTSTTTAAEWTANINKLKSVISVFRQEMPNVKLGYYIIMPERNWLAPCGTALKKRVTRTAAWHQRNLKMQPLADVVDIIVPSLYTFYLDAASVACWPNYAKANIAEARIYGKPVWAFLMPKIHRSTTMWIPQAFWRTQLETVYANADGLAIWSAAGATDKWSWTAPWWVETADFLRDKGLAPVTN
jgi:hypothetical protein